jgi:hypothetical protein
VLDSNAVATASDYIPAASLTGLNGTGLGGGSYSVPTGVVLSALPNLSTGIVPLPTSVSTTTIQNPFDRGYINSFNAMLQQDIGRGLVFETGYVGSYAIRPLINMNMNASAPGQGSAGGLLSQKWGKNYTGNINALVPFKNNNYNSLQTKVTQRLAQGSNWGLAYTWSKAINYEDNEDLSSLAFPYPTYWNKARGLASFDRTNNIELWGVFVMPFGKGQHWAQSGPANWILGGWMVSPIISKLSGSPFTVSANGTLNANGSGQTADLVGAYKQMNGRPPRTGVTCAQTDLSCHFFDPSAFAAPLIPVVGGVPVNPHYGNTNRNEFRGPGFFNMNLSVMRDFKLTERFTLGFRADALSLTNTPHFANPNVTCPGDPTTGASCSTGSNNNFGVITATAQPGGFFGPDSGSRVLWLGANIKF